MKVKKFYFLPATLFSVLFLASSCSNKKAPVENKKDISNRNDKTDIKKVDRKILKNKSKVIWDDKITIGYKTSNFGFEKIQPADNKSQKDKFLELLTKRFKEFQQKDETLRKLPSVSFELKRRYQDNQLYNDLKANNSENVDLGIVSYSLFSSSLKNDEDYNNLLPIIAQTSTLKFKWYDGASVDDFAYYVDGKSNDKLRKLADKQNDTQFKKYEYPEWYKYESELKWDGSKYKLFHDENDTAFTKHSAILISGDDAKRGEIISAWENKNWDKFKSFGLIYEDKQTDKKYKYHYVLLAWHFNKSIEQISRDIKSRTNLNVLKVGNMKYGFNVSVNNKSYHIGFDEAGAFSWTKSEKNSKNYVAANYPKSHIRNLIYTNPVPNDLVISRNGLDIKQKKLLIKALTSLSIDENIFGHYTGYNRFHELSFENFKRMLSFQKFAESSTTDYKELKKPDFK
ncbi:hypothetical protein NPA07_01545 [Mycoplasmopsis caviae]|uniref:High affinity transport system protein p37 n=1 Tax=Mycoplasmopsis caviae TaxID=55603 RepID=A0A3P8MDE6_9BACT|nr:hypothetical protein [Mycoplasmopsis caviae]UUD35539.1 hypothetical protein NPA07_01545 [Mycoplasmopsis caviae]VDR41690.1 High affinity transport system protein p37 precursor [Mycoplasmopsis caviae]